MHKHHLQNALPASVHYLGPPMVVDMHQILPAMERLELVAMVHTGFITARHKQKKRRRRCQ